MRDPYQRYAQAGQVLETSQRKMESAALLATARDLRLIVDNWDTRRRELVDALERNKLLWTVLASEVADNAELPRDLKQNILSLSIFIFKQTLSLMGTPDKEKVGVLININRALADGLAQ